MFEPPDDTLLNKNFLLAVETVADIASKTCRVYIKHNKITDIICIFSLQMRETILLHLDLVLLSFSTMVQGGAVLTL